MATKEDIVPAKEVVNLDVEPTATGNSSPPQRPTFSSQLWLLTPFLLLHLSAGLTGGFTTVLVQSFNNFNQSEEDNQDFNNFNQSEKANLPDFNNFNHSEKANLPDDSPSCQGKQSPILLG